MTLPSLTPGAAAAFLASVLFLKFRRRTETPAAPPKPASPPKSAPLKAAPPKAAAQKATPPKTLPPKAVPPAASTKPVAKPPPKPVPKAAVARVATQNATTEPPAPDLANVWSELDDLVTSEPTEPPEPAAEPWARVDPELENLDNELLAPPRPRGKDRIDELLEELRRTTPQKAVVRPRVVAKKPAKRT